MGWETSDRRSRLPKDWDARVKAVRKRSGGVCELDGCDRKAKEVDHITRGDDHSLGNLQDLCWTHHREKTLGEARRAQGGTRDDRRRAVETHPGGALVGADRAHRWA